MRLSRVAAVAVLSLVARAAGAQPECFATLAQEYISGMFASGCTVGGRILLSNFHYVSAQHVDLSALALYPNVDEYGFGFTYGGNATFPAGTATSDVPDFPGTAFVSLGFRVQPLVGSITGVSTYFPNGYFDITSAAGYEPMATVAFDEAHRGIDLVNQAIGFEQLPVSHYCAVNFVSVPCSSTSPFVVSYTLPTSATALDPTLDLSATVATTGHPTGSGTATAEVIVGGVRFAVSTVPEPATVTLVGAGVLLLGVGARRRRRA